MYTQSMQFYFQIIQRSIQILCVLLDYLWSLSDHCVRVCVCVRVSVCVCVCVCVCLSYVLHANREACSSLSDQQSGIHVFFEVLSVKCI